MENSNQQPPIPSPKLATAFLPTSPILPAFYIFYPFG